MAELLLAQLKHPITPWAILFDGSRECMQLIKRTIVRPVEIEDFEVDQFIRLADQRDIEVGQWVVQHPRNPQYVLVLEPLEFHARYAIIGPA